MGINQYVSLIISDSTSQEKNAGSSRIYPSASKDIRIMDSVSKYSQNLTPERRILGMQYFNTIEHAMWFCLKINSFRHTPAGRLSLRISVVCKWCTPKKARSMKKSVISLNVS